jgi:hypothetical protein
VFLKYRHLVSVGLFSFLFLSPFFCLAANSVHPHLILKAIHQVSAQETRDEVYFLVCDLDAPDGKFYTVPGYRKYITIPKSGHIGLSVRPHRHWQINDKNSIENVLLWQRVMKTGAKTQLVISLIESDLPPWDVDDMLGTIKINLVNKDGNLMTKILPFGHAKTVYQKTIGGVKFYKVQISNGKADYLVSFKLQDSD